jgi:hypothetical protein
MMYKNKALKIKFLGNSFENYKKQKRKMTAMLPLYVTFSFIAITIGIGM